MTVAPMRMRQPQVIMVVEDEPDTRMAIGEYLKTVFPEMRIVMSESGEAGLELARNACLALKPNGASCDLVGGAHQCRGGGCKFSRCYTPGSVNMGGSCFVDDACRLGKCSSIDGTNGTCVCKSNNDCGSGMWCDDGLDLKVNACRAKLATGATCGKAGSMGNDDKCQSGQCSGFPNYKCK